MNKKIFFPGLKRSLPGASYGAANLRLYRLAEAEAITGIRVRKLKELIRDGRLVGTRISKNDLRVSAADLQAFFETCKTRTIL